MNDLQRYQRNRFWLVVVALVILIIANLATGAVRPPADPPITNALPAVCLDENKVISLPKRGVFSLTIKHAGRCR